MANTLTTSLSGLQAAERAIATTSHNIANANTVGYSRQRTLNTSIQSTSMRADSTGSGVRTASIQRVHDQITESRLLSATTELNRVGTVSQMTERLNTLFSEENSGLNSAQINFFNALEEAGNNPHSSVPAQQAIATAETLSSRFNFVGDQLSSLQKELNSDIKNSVSQINNLASSIYSINKEISNMAGAGEGTPPNDLLDQRDQLLQQLSEYVDVGVSTRDRNGIDLTLGNGLALVTLAGPVLLNTEVNSADPGKLAFSMQTRNGSRAISDPPGGGILGGLLEFSQQTLDPVRQEVGRLAAVLAANTNTAFGLTASNNPSAPPTGAEFFNQPAITAFENAGNQGSATVTANMIDPKVTVPSNYKMTFDGSEYTLTRLSDNTQLTGTGDLLMDGIQFTSNGNAVAGDSFLIQPFTQGASLFSVANPDPSGLADMVGNSQQQLIPVAQRMAEVQNSILFGDESTTLTEQYATIVTNVGTTARTAEIQLQSMQNILEETQLNHDQISAVSLDEEAANLIKYQQTYEAAARVMTVSGTLFDTLLGTLNRI